MKHRSTRELFAYWDKRRRERRVPERADIEPGEIRRVLGDTFILTCDRSARHPFRLAGTRLCALFGRELKGESFLDLWDDDGAISDLLSTIGVDGAGAVAAVGSQTERGATLPLEMLLLPLRHRGQPCARIIGLLVPMSTPYWLGTDPLTQLMLGGFRHVGSPLDRVAWPQFQSGAAAARPMHNLVVIDGGRRD